MDFAEFDGLVSRTQAELSEEPPEGFAAFDAWRSSEEDIARAEDELDVRLPSQYKEFMLRYGGGGFLFLDLLPIVAPDRRIEDLVSVNLGSLRESGFSRWHRWGRGTGGVSPLWARSAARRSTSAFTRTARSNAKRAGSSTFWFGTGLGKRRRLVKPEDLRVWIERSSRLSAEFERGFETRFGYPPGENRVLAAEGVVSGDLEELAKLGVPTGLLDFYACVREVSLPDLGNGVSCIRRDR
ncbi:SMI1/KNR4 family protein [Amycolatopsis japonica]|uniref:SMI1/KNR4 family protein n=1 Tax=Amycolatopsis japonica TaxID=208439 RepID=UPI0033FECB1A